MSQRLLDQIKASIVAHFSATHPELLNGEIWVTNISDDSRTLTQGGLRHRSIKSKQSYDVQFSKVSWKTKRLGETAYNISGVRLPEYRPVFVQESEILNAPN